MYTRHSRISTQKYLKIFNLRLKDFSILFLHKQKKNKHEYYRTTRTLTSTVSIWRTR